MIRACIIRGINQWMIQDYKTVAAVAGDQFSKQNVFRKSASAFVLFVFDEMPLPRLLRAKVCLPLYTSSFSIGKSKKIQLSLNIFCRN